MQEKNYKINQNRSQISYITSVEIYTHYQSMMMMMMRNVILLLIFLCFFFVFVLLTLYYNLTCELKKSDILMNELKFIGTVVVDCGGNVIYEWQ